MRVAPLSEAMRSINRVQEKSDADSHQRHDRQNQQHEKDQPSYGEISDEKINAAITEFSTDEKNKVNGLTADRIGHGPGLKVVLRDGTGAVVRQFTGEEFLRVREAAHDGHPRGRLLDQKL